MLGSVAKPLPDVTPTPDAGAPTDEEVAKAVSKALAPFEAKLAVGLEKIAQVVAKHGDAIAKQGARVEQVEKARPTPRSGNPEGDVETVNKGDDDIETGAWPADMSDPDKHDVKKVDPALRFTATTRER